MSLNLYDLNFAIELSKKGPNTLSYTQPVTWWNLMFTGVKGSQQVLSVVTGNEQFVNRQVHH